MKPVTKLFFASYLAMAALVLTSCSGIKQPVTSGTGSGSGSGGSGSGGGGSSSSSFTIGGSVVGLTGTGLVLQNNGGDSLTITANGAFTFKTAVPSAYKVSVLTQPSNPTQTCSITNGAGTAIANVTNVQVTCGAVFPIGGTVSGLAGGGMQLQNNGADTLSVSGTGSVNFTFLTPVANGSPYKVTILTQPTNPAQVCSVTNGSGTTTGVINTVQVLCPQTGFSVGGTVVGLVTGPGDTVELQNNGGDNIFVTGNNQGFAFPTPLTNSGAYDVSMFIGPTSQPQPCWLFFYTGIATSNVSSVLVDCGHNDWTWMAAPDSVANFGAAALPPPAPPAQNTNAPGGRDYPATWTDNVGKKWLFGGFGLEVKGRTPPDLPGLLNDLWVWSPSDNAWIPANLPVTVNTTGVTTDTASLLPMQTTNTLGGSSPGSRWGSVTWTDASGNLCLFGGEGFSTSGIGLLNDQWKFTPGVYDVTDNAVPPTHIGSYTWMGNWTAVSGATNVNKGGTYGTQNVAAAGNVPGGRWGAAYVTDATGTVWVFGGQGFDSTTSLGLLNDLWKYNISTGQWTWVSGPNVGQQNGVYGTLGTASATNAPGGRQTAVLWADNSGNLWLFGGLGLDSKGTLNAGSLNGALPNGTLPNGALLNDLWKFNIGTGQWTWVAGSNVANQNGVYGTALTAAAGNVPGSRWSAAGWADTSGNLWFFGGWGYASSLSQSTGYLNDTWEFKPSTGQWTWWKGSSDVNQNGSVPTQFSPSLGVPFVNNVAGARRGIALWQPDPFDYVWVFGGEGYDTTTSAGHGYLNDLWTYLPFP
jgi:hypothetical protein